MAAKVGQVIVDFLLNTAKFETDIKKAAGSFKSMGRELEAVGKTMTAGITLPLAAAGAAAIKFANDIDEGMDKIRAKTGATGSAFADLGQSMRNVMANVPQGVDDISEAISALNVKLGLTGKPLESMAIQMLNFARITGSELGPLVKSAAELFTKWSVATNKQSGELDYLYKAARLAGVPIQRLTDLAIQFATPMKNMGLDLETAAVMLAQFEKAGVNTEQAMMGLNKGMSALAKVGMEPSRAIQQLVLNIREAKNPTDALALSVKYFGARAGAELASAIREGRFSIEDLSKAIAASKDTINDAARDTMSFSEKMALLRNKIALAAEPLGNALLKAFDNIMPYIEKAIEHLAKLAEYFASLPAPVQAFVLTLGALAAAAGPALMIIGSIAKGISTLLVLLPGLATGFTSVAAAMGPWGIAIMAAGGLILMFHDQIEDAIISLLKWTGVVKELPSIANKSSEAHGRMASQLKISTQTLDVFLASNKYAGSVLAQHRSEIDKLQISLAVGKITQAQYEAELRRIIDGQDKATVTTKKLGSSMGAAGIDADKLKKEMESLRNETAKALTPMDQLAEKLDKQMKLGFSKSDLVKLHTDEIIKNFEAQIKLGKPVTENERELHGLALEFKYATDRAGLLKDISEDLTRQMERLGESFPANELIDFAKHVDELKRKAQDALPALEDLGFTNDFLAGEMKKVEKASDAIAEAQQKAKEKAEALGKSLAQDLGGAVDRLSSSLAANIIDWRGWKDTIIGFGKDIAQSLLTSFLDGFLSPLKQALSNFGKGFGNWLTGLLSGGGGGGFNPLSWLGLGTQGGGGGLLGLAGSALGVGGAIGVGAATAAGASTGAAIGSMASIDAGMIGGGGAAVGGAGAAGGGVGGFGSSLAAFATNPITIGVAAAGVAAYLGYKFAKGPNSYEALDKEVTRDLGVNVNDKQMKAFFDAMGIKEAEAWKHRMEIEQSPQFMAYLLSLGLRPHTKEEAFKAPLAWGAVKNQWGPYDAVWSNWAFNELRLSKSPWGNLLIPNATSPENESDIPAYHSGIDFVPRDMLAYLQRGERVVPANENRTTIHGGDLTFNFYGVGENVVETIKTKVIPLLKKEMIGGNSGLREAVRYAYDHTARAY